MQNSGSLLLRLLSKSGTCKKFNINSDFQTPENLFFILLFLKCKCRKGILEIGKSAILKNSVGAFA